MSDYLAEACPRLAARLPKIRLADLPTPVETGSLRLGDKAYPVLIKRDDQTGQLYGGNKVRKLEYLLARARARSVGHIATFGAVGSNHALATALYARSLGYECTCFLSHQAQTPAIARTLRAHLDVGTELVRYGGGRANRIATLRRHLQRRRTFLIPAGGSNWLGAVGFVAAGLEFAGQVRAGEAAVPARVYVANGTMATAVGLALGFALAELDTELHAVQVTENFVSSPQAMQRLLQKTATLLNRLDSTIPADLAGKARYVFRTGYLGEGYARPTAAADRAVAMAADQLGLQLEPTYTGKALAALIDDLHDVPGNLLFWNTYNSRPLPGPSVDAAAADRLPGFTP